MLGSVTFRQLGNEWLEGFDDARGFIYHGPEDIEG